MPIEAFDDKTFETQTPQQWLANGAVQGRGLRKEKNGFYQWEQVIVVSYDEKFQKYIGNWLNDNSPAKLPRIKLVFDVINV
jgi:hypothetical protein